MSPEGLFEKFDIVGADVAVLVEDMVANPLGVEVEVSDPV
jgi:hypothetical protein